MVRFNRRARCAVLAAGLFLSLVSLPSTAIAGHTAPVAAKNELLVYPYPRAVRYHPGDAVRDPYHNDDFTVRVRVPGGDWQNLYAHNVRVDWDNPQNASMVYFDFKGRVEIAIEKNNGQFSQVRIRPNTRGIKPIVKDGLVSFTLDRPQNLSVEFDGDTLHNLHIFAGDAAIAGKRPPDGPNVVYFGPGLHTPDAGTGTFDISSGQTVFVDGGAVLEGSFRLENVHDITIIGHGLIENPKTPIAIKNSSNIHVEGLIVANPAPRMRSLSCTQSQHVAVSDLKSFSSTANGDGINVFSCEDVTFDKLFFRNSDDCIAIYTIQDANAQADVRRITVTNSTFWADVAHAMFIGIGGNPEKPQTIEDIVFRNIDVLELDEDQPEFQGVMAISAGDANLVRNVTFEDIRVDHIQAGRLFNFAVVQNQKYNKVPGQGIENVVMRNVTYTGYGVASPSIVKGLDDAHRVRHVRIENVRVGGKKISGTQKAQMEIGPYADDVVFH